VNPSVIAAVRRGDLLVLFRCLRKGKIRGDIFHSPAPARGAQLHMSNLSLILPLIVCGLGHAVETGLALVGGRHRGRAACVMAVHPRDMRHDWANTRGMLSRRGQISPDALKVFPRRSAPGQPVESRWTYAPGEYQTLAHRAFCGVAG